jgi:hypothetical protein
VYSLGSSQYILPSALEQRICARCPCCGRQLCVQITCTWRLIGTVAVTVVSDWSVGSVKRKWLEDSFFSDRVCFFQVRSPRAGLHTQRRKPRLDLNPAIFHLSQVVAVSMVPVFFLRFRNLSALLLPPDPLEPVYGKSRSVRVAMTAGCRVSQCDGEAAFPIGQIRLWPAHARQGAKPGAWELPLALSLSLHLCFFPRFFLQHLGLLH